MYLEVVPDERRSLANRGFYLVPLFVDVLTSPIQINWENMRESAKLPRIGHFFW